MAIAYSPLPPYLPESRRFQVSHLFESHRPVASQRVHRKHIGKWPEAQAPISNSGSLSPDAESRAVASPGRGPLQEGQGPIPCQACCRLIVGIDSVGFKEPVSCVRVAMETLCSQNLLKVDKI